MMKFLRKAFSITGYTIGYQWKSLCRWYKESIDEMDDFEDLMGFLAPHLFALFVVGMITLMIIGCGYSGT